MLLKKALQLKLEKRREVNSFGGVVVNSSLRTSLSKRKRVTGFNASCPEGNESAKMLLTVLITTPALGSSSWLVVNQGFQVRIWS